MGRDSEPLALCLVEGRISCNDRNGGVGNTGCLLAELDVQTIRRSRHLVWQAMATKLVIFFKNGGMKMIAVAD